MVLFENDMQHEHNGLETDVTGTFRIDEWITSERELVTSSEDPKTQLFIQAVEQGADLPIMYIGGAYPMTARFITPKALFRVKDFGDTLYLKAWCHRREEDRVFRMDKIQISYDVLMKALGLPISNEDTDQGFSDKPLSSVISVNMEEIESLDDFQLTIANRMEAPTFHFDRLTSVREIVTKTFDELTIVFSGLASLKPEVMKPIMEYITALKGTADAQGGRLNIVVKP